MEICCVTPLMASSVAPSFLASSKSLFFANGGSRNFSKTRLALVSRSRRHSAAVPRRPGGCRCLFGLGVPELVVIAGVAALVFGPKKLPEIGRSIGKTVKSFQEAAKEFETELKREPGEVSEAASGLQPKATASEGKEVKTSSTKEDV